MNNFKKTILLGGAALCFYPAALFAETCGTTPSCSSLGFTVPAASLSTSCKDKTYLKCPFGDYYFCSFPTGSTLCAVVNCAKCKDGSSLICETCKNGYLLFNGSCTVDLDPNPIDPGTGSGCNGSIRICQGRQYCCPSGAKTPCDSGYNTGLMCYTTSLNQVMEDPY